MGYDERVIGHLISGRDSPARHRRLERIRRVRSIPGDPITGLLSSYPLVLDPARKFRAGAAADHRVPSGACSIQARRTRHMSSVAEPNRLARRIYRYRRGVVRVATIPVRRLPETSPGKRRARSLVLRHQHSLPTELAVNRGDTVVQVGTPNPATMRRFLRSIGRSGRLVIVEAMPENQERLARAIAELGTDNVQLVRAAACNESRAGRVGSLTPLGRPQDSASGSRDGQRPPPREQRHGAHPRPVRPVGRRAG